MEAKDKKLLTINEAAEMYNIGRQKLYELTDEKNCDFVLFVGTKRLIKTERFDRWLEKTYSI